MIEIARKAQERLRQLRVNEASISGAMQQQIAEARRLAGMQHALDNPRVVRLQAEIAELRSELQKQANALSLERAGNQRLTQQATELSDSIAQLQQKEELAFLLGRVSPDAHDALFTDAVFREKFFSSEDCNTFVVSVDIRRSTELMLKARKPQLFAKFISETCSELESIIKLSHGVFDKFTGDGVLAFFPDFYSGPDAGLLALDAAQRCQEAFSECYKQHRRSFATVMTDVGLGIGIDYGPVHLLRVAGGITVVGSPVVYACRLSGAPAGHVYVNQPAFEVMFDKHGSYCYASESSLDIKHEGNILCYDVKLGKTRFNAAKPEWQQAHEVSNNSGEVE